MPDLATLQLPKPVSKNVWKTMHWAARRRIHDGWIDEAGWQLVGLPSVPAVTVDLLVRWDKPGPLPDEINLDMAHELIADACVAMGVIDDDSGKQYQRGTMTLERAAKGKGMTIATVRA